MERQVEITGSGLPSNEQIEDVCYEFFRNVKDIEVRRVNGPPEQELVNVYIQQEENVVGWGCDILKERLQEKSSGIVDEVDSWKNDI